MIKNKSAETIKECMAYFTQEQKKGLNNINTFLRSRDFTESEIDDFFKMMVELTEILNKK